MKDEKVLHGGKWNRTIQWIAFIDILTFFPEFSAIGLFVF
jgi:hypothetical protein